MSRRRAAADPDPPQPLVHAVVMVRRAQRRAVPGVVGALTSEVLRAFVSDAPRFQLLSPLLDQAHGAGQYDLRGGVGRRAHSLILANTGSGMCLITCMIPHQKPGT